MTDTKTSTAKPFTILQGNCLNIMKTMPANSVDAIVTDPPYGLSFMGKKWDYDVPSVDIWKECLRVLKPGGHLLAFAGTRTQHRMAVNIEDAGFEIRDMIAWVYGSGFPKSLNIGKAVDKLQGNEREVVGKKIDLSTGKPMSAKQAKAGNGKNINEGWDRPWRADDKHCEDMTLLTKGTSEWEGWGTALKPALEPITVARKPIENTVAENVLKWGTGGINIDGCRVGHDERTYKGMSAKQPDVGTFRDDNWQPKDIEVTVNGRFPANLIHDGSDEVVGLFPETGASKAAPRNNKVPTGQKGIYGNFEPVQTYGHDDNGGSAARFFYVAKASKSERDAGLDVELKRIEGRDIGQDERNVPYKNRITPRRNQHPTVKPISLMRYLVRLVTPPDGIVLDPFAGSGSTGCAAALEDFNFIGIEMEPEYVTIAENRIGYWYKKHTQSKSQQKLQLD
jgi:DNA modification methylase